MKDDRAIYLASALVVGTGALWGLYWLPVRRLADAGLPGAWGTLAAAMVAAVVMAPLAVLRWHELRRAPPRALFFTALGGAAFVLYSVGLLYGRVAIIILLFYLTPVWSTLIGRFVMGWRSPPTRTAAIVIGLAGLAIILGAGGGVMLPSSLGEWLALLSGVLWSVASTGIRVTPGMHAAEAGFVFVLGAFAGALVLAPFLAPVPAGVAVGPALGWGIAAGALWWAAFMTALMWATSRLDPTRVGILLMSEVLVGALSGVMLAGEHLGPSELGGGALILAAALLELWPVRAGPGGRGAPARR